MENNARCPKCNIEFETEGVKTLKCPNCGVELDALRARKYYTAFHDKSVEREMHGKDYFKYDDFLRVGAHHLAEGEFEQAEQAYVSALDLNPSDYRGYMGLVAVETRNYTDVKNTTHKKYLKKAISVADEEQKKHIADAYRTFNAKASMSDEEFEEYVTEKQKDYKARIKKAIIGFSQANESTRKKAKTCKILTFVFIGLGLISLVLGFIFSYPLMVLGAIIACSSYAFIIVWQKQKFNESLYVFLVELFNGMVKYNLTYEQTEKVLGFMSSLLISVRDENPATVTNGILSNFVEYAISLNNKEMLKYMEAQKITAQHLK